MKYSFCMLINILSLSYCYSQQLNDSNFHNTISMWYNPNLRPQVVELYGEIEDWNTSEVTDMSQAFNNTSFNNDISSWDVSNVTNMFKMFFQAYNFNQPIGTWDVSQVTNMNQMFHEAISFNQDISEWNVSSVTNMNQMFSHAHQFNQDLSSWNFEAVSNLENFLFLSLLNVENYDALIISLSNQNLTNDINFGAWPLNYCNSQSERDAIINDFGWNISDGGLSYNCEIIIQGCTDPNSINYDEDATFDDGSCICCYYGCTDELAINYNPNAYYNNGSCEYISGCTDSSATNYAPQATLDDGSCLYPDNPCDNAPTGLTVNNIIHNRVTFNWDQPSALPSYYMIRYRIQGLSSWTVISAGSQNINPYSGVSRTRYFLEDNTTYEWSIRARIVNASGSTECQSDWSENAIFTTLPSCPNLENLSVETEANWVTFTANEPIGDWQIWQSKGKIRESGTSNYRYVNGDSSIDVLKGNFTPNTSYEWHTKAWCTGNSDENGISDSQYHSGWGSFMPFTTQDSCDKIPNNLNTTNNSAFTAITMSWDTPTNGQPDHYFLELTNLTTGQVWAWNNLSGSSNTKTKFGLSAGDYSWRIRGACGTNGISWATPFTAYQFYSLGSNRLNTSIENIYVYPNPTNGIFNISVTLPNIQNVDIKIINSIGQELVTITKFKTDSFEQNLNLMDFPKGLYILSINTAFNISRTRLILQ